MSAQVAEDVSASLGRTVDDSPKDVSAAEGAMVVFKEEAVEHEGNPGEDESGKSRWRFLLLKKKAFGVKAETNLTWICIKMS